MQPLKALWDKQQLAIVEATGSPDPSRSHFDAQDYMESGTSGKTTGDGWLNRRCLPAADAETSPLRAVAMGNQVPRTLRGEREAIAVGDSQQFNMGNQDAAAILENMYATSADAQWGRTGKDAFEAMKMIQSINRSPNNPQGRSAIRARRRTWPQPAAACPADQGRRRSRGRLRRDRRLGPSWQRESAAAKSAAPVLQRHWRHSARIWATGWKTSSW